MRRIPDSLSSDDQAALLNVIGRRYASNVRNHTLVALMLATGLRCAEALALRWDDIDLQTGEVRVRQGKGGKDRIVWSNVRVLDLLHDWRQRSPHALVFPTKDGGPLSSRYVRASVKQYGKRAGIKLDVHPHLLRHTFATELYRRTKDIRLVQRALGHADVRHTQIYTHVSDAELQAAMRTEAPDAFRPAQGGGEPA